MLPSTGQHVHPLLSPSSLWGQHIEGWAEQRESSPATAPQLHQLSHAMDQAAAERKRTGRRAVCQEGLEGTNISQLKCQGCPSFVWLRHSSAHLKNVDILLDTMSPFKKTMFYTGITLLQNTQLPKQKVSKQKSCSDPFSGNAQFSHIYN